MAFSISASTLNMAWPCWTTFKDMPSQVKFLLSINIENPPVHAKGKPKAPIKTKKAGNAGVTAFGNPTGVCYQLG